MLARAAAIKQCGVNLIVLLALSDAGHPAYEAETHRGNREPWVFAWQPRSVSLDDGGCPHRKGFTELGSRSRYRSHPRILSTTSDKVHR
jgi:hypothetical protein